MMMVRMQGVTVVSVNDSEDDDPRVHKLGRGSSQSPMGARNRERTSSLGTGEGKSQVPMVHTDVASTCSIYYYYRGM
jgi:hypothetical protein